MVYEGGIGFVGVGMVSFAEIAIADCGHVVGEALSVFSIEYGMCYCDVGCIVCVLGGSSFISLVI